MTDILIRGISAATVAEIDCRARHLGISRNEYLRRWLDQGIRATTPVTIDDFRWFRELARDLADPEVMRQAWTL
ncbi:MAG: hypothetical protein J2P32_07465 [Actinobacteria bacterium]|nr:hypothetical protein [Actinomycetota bacterium]